MKTKHFFWSALLAAGLAVSSCTKTMEADYAVIPLPAEISAADGSFKLDGDAKIVYPADNAELKRNAEFLKDYIKQSTGLELALAEGTEGKGGILLTAGLENENPEAYKLTVNAEGVVIDGASAAGNFYGIQTLRKSLPVVVEGVVNVDLPAVEINDAPRFSYRGMHFDVSRHFYSVDEVKKFIDMQALHNMNRLHWHITDDQGWRIEIKKYPKLTEIGSQRKETVIGHNSGVYDGKPYGGFYTQDEVRDIVAYAAERYITIVPEIDMPGHMQGALASYPELGCTGGPYEVWTMWGVSEDVLCAGKESTFEFVEGVLDEVLELFPSEYIHIGGDECPKTRWAKCPACQKRIKAEGLKAYDKHTKEQVLQSYFITRVGKYLTDKGRKFIGWNEILEGGLDPNAVVMAWTGPEPGIEAAKQGNDVIMTPSSYLYFDYYQAADIANEPDAIGGYVPVERVYGFEPLMPGQLTPEESKHIIGVQANLWTEYIPTFAGVEYMAMPRAAALSEIQWVQPEKKDYNNFLLRIGQLFNLYNKCGYNYAKHLFNVEAVFTPNLEKGVMEVTLNCVMGGDIYYTLDGTEPTEKSPKYEAPFEIDRACTLKAVVINRGTASRVLSKDIAWHKSSMKPITLTKQPFPRYAHNGGVALVDGLKGSINYNLSEWLGFKIDDVEAVIDLKEPMEISNVATSANVQHWDWVMAPTHIKVAVSDDGEAYKEVAFEELPPFGPTSKDTIYDYKVDFQPVQARFVKVLVKNQAQLPEWHSCAGEHAFVFVDEIAVN